MFQAKGSRSLGPDNEYQAENKKRLTVKKTFSLVLYLGLDNLRGDV